MLNITEMIRVARGDHAVASAMRGSPLRYDRNDAPVVVVWNVCSHCNMSCPHCYASAIAVRSPTDLNHAEALSVIEQLADAGVKVLIFSGGEPLLRPDVVELMAYARDRGLVPQLSSNGVMIEAETAAQLSDAGVAYVGVSLDGLRDFNDSYRGLDGGFDRALAGLRFSRDEGMRTGARMTVTAFNAPMLPELLDIVAAEGIDRFYVSHLVYSGRAYQLFREGSGALSPQDSRALLLELFENTVHLMDTGATTAVVTGGNDSCGPVLLRWLLHRFGEDAAVRAHTLLDKKGGNSAGDKLLAIDARGRVMPDQFWRDRILADLRTVPFADALAHPLRAELKTRGGRLGGRCGRCVHVPVCGGSHRERAWAAYGDIWAEDPGCLLDNDELTDAPWRAAGGM